MEQAEIKQTLRILMLEDTLSDAELEERELRKIGHAVHIEAGRDAGKLYSRAERI